MIEKIIYSVNTVTPNVYGESFSLYEQLGKAFLKCNEIADVVNNMLTTGIEQPLRDALDDMALSGELGTLIQELIVIDGGTF